MRVLSLFSGIGGLDLAAEWAGMTTVAFCERDKYCQKVLAKHWPGVPIFDDVMTLCRRTWMNNPQDDDYVECSIHAGEDFGDCACIGTDQFLDEHGAIDVITGGFPCQPFSASGKQLGAGDDRYLWPECLRLIEELGPTWFVGENVIGIVELALDNVLASLEGIGYAARAFDIPARSIGAVHSRRRIFIVANSNGIGCENTSFGHQAIRQFERGTAEAFGLSKLPESAICRADDGIPNRVDRLRALGNAVVPQQAYPIFKAIAEVSRV